MYLQGGAVWHPRCGPSPDTQGQTLNGSAGEVTDGNVSDAYDRHSTSGVSELQV